MDFTNLNAILESCGVPTVMYVPVYNNQVDSTSLFIDPNGWRGTNTGCYIQSPSLLATTNTGCYAQNPSLWATANAGCYVQNPSLWTTAYTAQPAAQSDPYMESYRMGQNIVTRIANAYNFATQPTTSSSTTASTSSSSRTSTTTSSIKGNNGIFKYTASSQAIRREAGSYFHKKDTYTPKRGDIAIWTNVNDPAHGHVGIVAEVTATTVTIIEGNSSNRVKKNTYPISKLQSTARFAGFIDMASWASPERAEKAVKVAEKELAKGVHETSTNYSSDIARYKAPINGGKTDQWCAYFTSYCFHDGQSQLA